MKLIIRKICTKDILRKLVYSDAWPGSSSGRGSNSPITADRVERYVQQTWTESICLEKTEVMREGHRRKEL